MPASRFCQMAYVTNDLDAAMAVFRDRQGVGRFVEFRGCPVEIGPERNARLDIALAYAGGIQIELIQPRGGDDGIYREILRGDGGFELHFHHEGQQARSLAELGRLRAEAIARGLPVAIDGKQGDDVFYFYVDCRSTIGHFLEIIWYSDRAQARLDGAIPVN